MRELEDASIMDRYIATKAKISELQEELDEMKGALLYALMEEPEEKFNHKGFEFSIQRRKQWAGYSDNVAYLTDELKALKKHEQKHGPAEMVKDSAVLILKQSKK